MAEIEIICNNNNNNMKRTYPIGTSLFNIAEDLKPELNNDIIAALVNNKPKELSYQIFKPKTISFLDINSIIGYSIYMRSLIFLLYKATKDLYPNYSLKVAHSMPIGVYCELEGLKENLSNEMIEAIRGRMQQLIDENLPFVREELLTSEAIKIFKDDGLNEKVELFKTRKVLYTSVYTLYGTPNYFYGYLLPSTKYIKDFRIEKYFGNGLIAKLPEFLNNNINSEETTNDFLKEEHKGGSKLFKIFQEHKKWLKILNVSYVGQLNAAVLKNGAERLIKISEGLHERKIASIADEITERKSKIVLISGPSSSGKTTFSKRLAIQLEVLGCETAEISLDCYFVDREKTPLDENGEYDFESIDAIDIDFFNKQLNTLISSDKEIELPMFDFKLGKRFFNGSKLKMSRNTILIVEGIHGLNPKLTASIKEDNMFKIFVSALTHIAIDPQNPIKSTHNRLIRRIVRDYNYRGYSAKETLKRWPSVRKGENENIFPYQENADIMFNSALLFELGVLKKYAEPLLREINENSETYAQAYDLQKFLSYFVNIEDKDIPPTSILREFLGNSSFIY